MDNFFIDDDSYYLTDCNYCFINGDACLNNPYMILASDRWSDFGAVSFDFYVLTCNE